MARDVLVLLGAKGLSFRVHMALAVVVGMFVMIAPSLYNYRAELTGFQYFLHVFYGLGFITVVSLSSRKPKGETISLESRRAA